MKLVACVLGWLGVLACAGVVQAQTVHVVDLPTRPGVTQRVLVVQPEHAADLGAVIARLPAASRLLTFQGGIGVGDPCRAFAHLGYNGIESQVVAGIAVWAGVR